MISHIFHIGWHRPASLPLQLQSAALVGQAEVDHDGFGMTDVQIASFLAQKPYTRRSCLEIPSVCLYGPVWVCLKNGVQRYNSVYNSVGL
jgi:hypothetical protein